MNSSALWLSGIRFFFPFLNCLNAACHRVCMNYTSYPDGIGRIYGGHVGNQINEISILWKLNSVFK